MVDEQKYLDAIQIQKYLNLISQFLSREISSDVFERSFLETRRNDSYWMSGSFEKSISQILDSFFLDVDEYVPDDLYDDTNKFNINENKLRERAKNTLERLHS